jgi:hypothetical protein
MTITEDWALAVGRNAPHPRIPRSLGDRFLERFWSRVQRTGTCWLWTAGRDAYGYGQIHRPGQTPIKVHRASWMLVHGRVKSDKHVLHHCDVRNCVNPAHLFLGDQAVNNRDAASKRRRRKGPRKKDAPKA